MDTVDDRAELSLVPSATTSANSPLVPMVEPRSDHWNQKRRRRSISTIGPDVAPQVTSRPPGRIALSERFQVALPTESTITSAPPPKCRLKAAPMSASLSIAISAPIAIARSRLAADDEVTAIRAPR